MGAASDYAFVACYPGCGWNGEVALGEQRRWTCPSCGERRTFRSHRDEPATCPTCGSDDVNHQEPAHYLRTGRECHDPFHAEADDG